MARTSTTKVTARERARAAKAVLDAERRDHEKAVEDATTTYYEAQDARDAAITALEDADTARGVAVQSLLDRGEPPARVAVLVGLTAAEVRKLKRTAAAEDSTESSGQAVETPDPSTGPPRWPADPAVAARGGFAAGNVGAASRCDGARR